MITRLGRLASRLLHGRKSPTPLEQWEDRARRYGVRAVLNLGHPDDEVDRVTERQRRDLYPLLRAALRGGEQLLLDFGCGPGRFTPDLAEMIGGRAIGVDPIRRLLELAPRHPRVEYRLMTEARIPVDSGSIDVLWICLVLGGIRGPALDVTLREIRRVLRPEALVFLVENTTEGGGGDFWTFRSIAEYRRLLEPIRLDHIHDYQDLGERISVMRGRSP